MQDDFDSIWEESLKLWEVLGNSRSQLQLVKHSDGYAVMNGKTDSATVFGKKGSLDAAKSLLSTLREKVNSEYNALISRAESLTNEAAILKTKASKLLVLEIQNGRS